ncbi:MAG: conjugal transfer protein TraI, partial [Sphingobacterium sp.]
MMNQVKISKIIILLVILLTLPSSNRVYGQLIISQVISAGVKRAIKAVDLRIQRLQNRTIWLQNAQRTIENSLSKFKLDEIAIWSAKHKDQYQQYYRELLQVKSMIRFYSRIKEAIQKQLLLVKEYGRIWRLLRKDRQFTTAELNYMGEVYQGILTKSLKNIDFIQLAARSFSFQMTDA